MVAGAVAAVVLALLVGTGFSTGFGIDARNQAELANKERADAIAARNEVTTANETLFEI